MDPNSLGLAIAECFTIADTAVLMSNFAGFSVIADPGAGLVSTASLESILDAKLHLPSHQHEFRSFYGCPRYNGSQRFRLSMLETELILKSQNLGCPPPASNTLICPETCLAALNSLSEIFNDTAICEEATSPAIAANRERGLMHYMNICRQLPSASNCFDGVSAETGFCGFLDRAHAHSFCEFNASDQCCQDLSSHGRTAVGQKRLVRKADSSPSTTFYLQENIASLSSSSYSVVSESSGLLSDSGLSTASVIALSLGLTLFVSLSFTLLYCFITRKRMLREFVTTSLGEGQVAAVFLNNGAGYLINFNHKISKDDILSKFSWENAFVDETSKFGTFITFSNTPLASLNDLPELSPDSTKNKRVSQDTLETKPEVLSSNNHSSIFTADDLESTIAQVSQSLDPRRIRTAPAELVRARSITLGVQKHRALDRFKQSQRQHAFSDERTLPQIAEDTDSKKDSVVRPFSLQTGISISIPSAETEESALQPHKELFKVQALFAYNPDIPDELELKVGDVIAVTKMYDDGWAAGFDQRGRLGVFPLACVCPAEADGKTRSLSVTMSSVMKRKSSLAITYLLHVLAAVALASPSPPQENILPDMTSDDLAVVHLRAVDFDSDGAIRTGGDWFLFFGNCKRGFRHSMTERNGQVQAFTPKWLKIQEENSERFLDRGLRMAKIDCFVHSEFCRDVLPHIPKYPTLRIYHDGKYLKQYEEEEFEIAPVAKFVESYYGTLSAVASPSKIEKAVAHLQKLLAKRNDASTTNPNGVNVVLKGSTFDKAIEDAVVPYFVKFYAPWCTHCKHLAPIWEDLASQLRGKANIGEIDCTVDGSICTRENVRGYPSLRFMFPNLGSIEYSGRRALEDLKSYVQSVVEGSAVIVTSGKEITELAKRKEVAMVYVYDAEAVSDASLLNFLEVARSVKPLVSIYATPDHIAAAKSFGIDFDKLPALICVKDGGMEKRLYNPPLAPLDNKSQKVGLRTWILDNRHALVPQLTDANSREIMGNQRDSSEKLVVLGILDPVAQNGRQAIDSLRAAAKEWGKVGNSDKTVIFTWINGASKADYVKRVFGVNAESDMPTVVIVDPKEDQVYWKDEKGEALSLRRKDQLVNSVSLILAGNLRGQHISGWSGAITKAVERTVVPIVEFAVMHPIVFVVSLAVAVGVLLWVCMWAIDAGDAAAASEAAHRRNGSDLKRD